MSEAYSWKPLYKDADNNILETNSETSKRLSNPKQIFEEEGAEDYSVESNILRKYDSETTEEELGILFTDNEITLGEFNEGLSVLNSARCKNDVSVLQKYLQEASLNPKVRRSFEVAEHYFSLENKDGILDKLEDFVFDKEEFFSYFKQPDYLRGIEGDGEEAFYSEYGPYVADDFFESKYYSQEGVLGAFDFLEREEAIIVKEEQEWRENNAENIHTTQDTPLTEEESWKEYTSDLSEFLTSDSEEKSLWDDWYNQRSFLFTCLGKVGDHKAVDFALSYFEKSPENIYRNDVVDLCSKVDVGYSADCIIKLIDGDNISRYDKYDYSRMLYRLELGRIGVSEEGVEYLGKRFDLGLLNSSDNYVRRLTPTGDVAVFGQDEKMTGIFNIGDLTDNTEVVRPKVLDITYDLLFEQKEDGSEEDRLIKDRILKEFTDNYYSFYDQDFLQDTGVHVNNLALKEQGWFMHYMLQVPVRDDLDRVTEFVQRYGENGFRTFLALEQGDQSLGDKIVEFGVNKNSASKVFMYYGELLDGAEEAERLVRKVTACEDDACADLAKQVRENILNRAQKDLERAVQLSDVSEIESLISNYAVEAKEYVALLQEVDAENIEKIDSSELSEEDKGQMGDLLKTNYDLTYPGEENSEFRLDITESLFESFTNPSTSFSVLRDGEKIVSFNRFDSVQSDGGRNISYFGSFNVDPAYSGVGEIVLKKTIEKRLENGQPMMAHCDSEQAITRKYVNEGFVVIDKIDNFSNSSVTAFEIWRIQGIDKRIRSKSLPEKELLELIGNGGDILVREISSDDEYEEVKQGKSLTRYFNFEDKEYGVFEKLPDDLRKEFSLVPEGSE